jgi:integral membrane sensor domain MASE1
VVVAGRSRGMRRYVVLCGLIVGVAAAYVLGAWLGLRLAVVREQVTPLWLPTGIALGSLLLFGMRVWPGITIGAFLANIFIGPSFWAVVVISVGNTLAPVVAALLLVRVGFRQELDRLRDALALVFVGALGGMLISATLGAGTLWVADSLPPSGFWSAWTVWWAGDAMGVLVGTPVVLVASKARWPKDISVLRWLEAAAVILGTVAITVVLIRQSMRLLFPVFPLLIWSAVRFQLKAAAPCALIIAVGATFGAVHATGPFADLNLLEQMIILLTFNASTALTALLLSAITTQRNQALKQVERAVTQLNVAMTTLEPYRVLKGGVLGGESSRASKDQP